MNNKSFYFVETIEFFNNGCTTEEGYETLEGVKYHLKNHVGFPNYVVEAALENMGYKDSDYGVKITLMEANQ